MGDADKVLLGDVEFRWRPDVAILEIARVWRFGGQERKGKPLQLNARTLSRSEASMGFLGSLLDAAMALRDGGDNVA